MRWSEGARQSIALDLIGEGLSEYRLHSPEAVRAMAVSLERYGQMSPIVVFVRDEGFELVDGFKRLEAARSVTGISALEARVVDVDERGAKAAMFGLNQVGGKTNELEEAWIVHALVREDGLTQLEVADLLQKHKSWVCRRLQLIEKLIPEAKNDLRVGLLSPTAGRELVRLPYGNQREVLDVVRREELTTSETQGVVDLLLAAAGEPQRRFVLVNPREALAQRDEIPTPARDPRLSVAGNRVAKRIYMLLDVLSRMEGWLKHPGIAELSERDREILAPSFTKLARDATAVGELSTDLFVGAAAR